MSLTRVHLHRIAVDAYPRRTRVTSFDSGVVSSKLEVDLHHFVVTLRGDGARVVLGTSYDPRLWDSRCRATTEVHGCFNRGSEVRSDRDVAITPASPGPRPRREQRQTKMLGTCKPVGDLDSTTAQSFDADLRDTIDSSDEALVVVDCSRVRFIDSAGYHVLAGATEYAVRRGHTLMIRRMSPSCMRLLRLYDPDRELHVDFQSREGLKPADLLRDEGHSARRSWVE